MKKKIILRSQQEQVDFVKIVSKFDCDITLNKNYQCVDAKSMIGVTTVDTSSDCYILIHSRDEEEINQIVNALGKYLVD